MKKRSNIEKVIDKLTKDWLGKNGVVSISDEEEDGDLNIVFFVTHSEIKDEVYPKEASGYKVNIRSSERIIAYS